MNAILEVRTCTLVGHHAFLVGRWHRIPARRGVIPRFLADCDLVDRIQPVSTTRTVALWRSRLTVPFLTVEKKKSWRQRRKEEILNLRDEVKQLSTELDQLNMQLGTCEISTSERSKLRGVSAYQLARVGWENVAEHQATLRQISNGIQTSCGNSEVSLTQARTLNRALKRKLRAVLASPEMDLIKQFQLRSTSVHPPLNNDPLTGIRMDQLYGGLDSFFKQVGMDQLPCPGLQNGSMNKGARATLVEFLDSYAMPFDLRQIEKAIWTTDTAGKRRSRHALFAVELTRGVWLQNATDDNARMIYMAFPFSLEGTDFHIVMRIVTRKYVEKDRIVFITRSLIEPSIGPLSFVETNRRVLMRGKKSSLGPTTIILTHREADSCEDILSANMTGCPSIDSGLKIWENIATQYNHALEDKLLRTSAEYDMVNVISSKTIDSPPQRSNWISSSGKCKCGRANLHQRQKAQVHRREVINQLSAQLQELKNAAKVRKQVLGSTSNREASINENKWTAHFMLRQTSEIENIKLRKAVRFQFRQAKSFQRALRKRIPEDYRCVANEFNQRHDGFEQDLLRSGARHA
ncbi:hypothetical protein GQ600_13602 [Phytophthora cactorum]|nr:hypothetical protein GQ600_13602 [Phytophthora cactorum]